MVDTQELLNKEYPKKEEVTVISLTELLYDKDKRKLKFDEEGELKIESFPNLTEIKIDKVGDDYIEFAKITKIIIADCPKLKKVDINTFVDNEKLAITNCPNLTYLDCSYSKLRELDLNDCQNLKTLDCNNNRLTKLGTDNLSDLTDLYCQSNRLTDITSLEKAKNLKILDLSRNRFSELSFLRKESPLTNLKTLYLDDNDEFNDSLKDLKTKTPNLKELGINEINIKLDLKELPNDLEKIYCNNEKLLQESLQSRDDKEKKEQELKKKLMICKKSDNEGEEYYDYQIWKRLVNAQEYLDEHYPKDGEIKIYNRSNSKKGEKRSKEEKDSTKKLNISNKRLWGDLKLEQFTDLQKLDCSNNHLTRLDLTDCKSLTHLTLSNNQFNNVDFLNTLPNKEKLKVLKMSNNEKLPSQTLDFLKDFTGLEELNIEDCPFEGSLEYLKNMKNLRKIYISHTEIEEGLEHLAENCKRLYCDFRYQSKHKTIEIVKQLGKHLEEGEIRYYSLDKWRQEKKDGVALIIPLDKLPTSKNSIKKFLDNWKDEVVRNDNNNETNERAWYSYYSNTSDEFILKDPEELRKRGERFSKTETTLKLPSIAGGILSLANYSIVGGAMSVVAPVTEFIVEQAGKKRYEADKAKWDTFVQDSEDVWDTYWELEETFKFIEPYDEVGKVNEALKNLKSKIKEFLKGNDDSIPEVSKSKFPGHLRNNWKTKSEKLEEIREAIEKLQKEVSDYRRAFLGKKDETSQQQEQIKVIKDKTDDLLGILKDIENYHQIINTNENHKGKIKEIIDNLQADEKKLRKEVESVQNELEVKDNSINDNQAGTSNSSHKGKSKKTNDNQSELQAVIIDKTHDYGSFNKK